MQKNKLTNTKNKNGITEIVFIIDKSGSMYGMEKDVIGGFNSTLEKQREAEGTCYVSTVMFSNESEVIHDRVNLDKIENMTNRDYQPGGGTALLDAVGSAIHHIANVHKYARPEDVPEHTIFIITTDGMENASYRYDHRKVKMMINRQQENFGWEFIFLAANIDAAEAADSIGIRRDRAVNYNPTSAGTVASYCAMSEAILAVRNKESLDNGMWRKNLDEKNK